MAKAKVEEVEEVVPEETPVPTMLLWCGPGDRYIEVADLFPDAGTGGVPEGAEGTLAWEYSNGWLIEDLGSETARRLMMADGQLKEPSAEQLGEALETRKVAEAEQLALKEAEEAARQVRSEAFDAQSESDSASENLEDATIATESDQVVIPDAGETVVVGNDTDSGNPEPSTA
jgi:hypothetical protein